MPALRIPNSLVPGFEAISNLSSEDVEIIISSISDLPIGFGPNSLTEKITEKGGNFKNIKPICFAVLNLGWILYGIKDVTPESVVDDLIETYQLQNKDAPPEKVDTFETNIKRILTESDKLMRSHKARKLVSDHENVFKESSIATDIRILFDSDLGISGKNSVVFHKLKINYFSDGKINEFFIALDNNDIQQLKRQLIRAEKKESSIRDNLKSLHIIDLLD